jgi:predicted nucleotidyltransferase component of viral defense system
VRIDFVNEAARLLRVKRRELIEKDIILHQTLLDLSKNEFFAPNFIFKGGTCLIKSYFGYLRFSEDIDFTWKDQSVFEGMSQKKIRSYLSDIINKTGRVFEEIAEKRGLDFRCVKSNPDYVELGGSNKTCTLKIWYQSEILNRRSFMKVQINFVESMCFASKVGKLRGLLTGRHPELEQLFPEYAEYAKEIRFGIYDLREILSEKVRALLTREGTKARDFLDAYFICKKLDVKLDDVRDCIISKTKFALRFYSKYRSNLKDKASVLASGKLFEWSEERDLLLSDIEEDDFYSFLDEFNPFLRQIVKELGY